MRRLETGKGKYSPISLLIATSLLWPLTGASWRRKMEHIRRQGVATGASHPWLCYISYLLHTPGPSPGPLHTITLPPIYQCQLTPLVGLYLLAIGASMAFMTSSGHEVCGYVCFQFTFCDFWKHCSFAWMLDPAAAHRIWLIIYSIYTYRMPAVYLVPSRN